MTAFPTSFDEVSSWGRDAEVSLAEARIRYVQYEVLKVIAGDRLLREVLVFKGGNALDFVLAPNRSTTDLDFTLDVQQGQVVPNASQLENSMRMALDAAKLRSHVILELNSFKQQPPGEDKTLYSYVVRIGYALPDEPTLRRRMQRGLTSSRVIPIEISVNDVLCASLPTRISSELPTMRIATLEDIVAEKLRALLQQPVRNRVRRQDVLDIAVLLERHLELDREIVA